MILLLNLICRFFVKNPVFWVQAKNAEKMLEKKCLTNKEIVLLLINLLGLYVFN
jgi:hypothetical protein